MTAGAIAHFVGRVGGFIGDARLYRCDPPMDDESDSTTEYVIVSAVANVFVIETYIFPSDESGHITSWGELPGSFQGGADHRAALAGAGYEVQP